MKLTLLLRDFCGRWLRICTPNSQIPNVGSNMVDENAKLIHFGWNSPFALTILSSRITILSSSDSQFYKYKFSSQLTHFLNPCALCLIRNSEFMNFEFSVVISGSKNYRVPIFKSILSKDKCMLQRLASKAMQCDLMYVAVGYKSKS